MDFTRTVGLLNQPLQQWNPIAPSNSLKRKERDYPVSHEPSKSLRRTVGTTVHCQLLLAVSVQHTPICDISSGSVDCQDGSSREKDNHQHDCEAPGQDNKGLKNRNQDKGGRDESQAGDDDEQSGDNQTTGGQDGRGRGGDEHDGSNQDDDEKDDNGQDDDEQDKAQDDDDSTAGEDDDSDNESIPSQALERHTTRDLEAMARVAEAKVRLRRETTDHLILKCRLADFEIEILRQRQSLLKEETKKVSAEAKKVNAEAKKASAEAKKIQIEMMRDRQSIILGR
ncbi:hypothetical protein BGX27_005557 [Mortierella sp. AM989]|nr:hypothetical protein BGX27_005557 [Mortierella sp. AM989]